MTQIPLPISTHNRAAENLSKLHDVDHQISGFPEAVIKEGRIFVRDGTLSKINPKKKIQDRHFFLFSDILVWCEKGGVKKTLYRYRGHLEVHFLFDPILTFFIHYSPSICTPASLLFPLSPLLFTLSSVKELLGEKTRSPERPDPKRCNSQRFDELFSSSGSNGETKGVYACGEG